VTKENMIKMVINGTPVEVPEGITILQACNANGVEIPTLCYLEGLLPEGSCRMCVVEVEGSPKLATACAAPVAEGMAVHTDSPVVRQTRKFVLDLLVAEHGGDCFSCKKLAVCKLRAYAMEYGVETTSYSKFHEKVPVDNSNPFFDLDRNKCILCGRCVRVCSSLECVANYTISRRGVNAQIGPAFNVAMEESSCVSCGNCVSNCPTGALSPKIEAPAYDSKKVLTTCSYCGVGCQMNLIVKNNRIIGVEPANGKSNMGLLCVKGKFAYNFVGHPDRLKTPLIKKDGKFVEASWDEAYGLVVEKITEIKKKHGADAIGGFSSARCPNEDNYVFQKFFRAAIGTNNVDHCARL